MKISPKQYGGIGAGFGALVVFGATFDTNLVYLTLVGGLVGGLMGQAAEKFQKKKLMIQKTYKETVERRKEMMVYKSFIVKY